MSLDFNTVLIEASEIADIVDVPTFGVQSGPRNKNFVPFTANSNNNSNLTYVVQVPNLNVVMNRQILHQAQLAFTVKYTGVTAGQSLAFDYGSTDCVQSFPLAKTINQITATINDTSVTTPQQQIIDLILKCNDKRILQRWNSTTPAYPDSTFGQYSYTNTPSGYSANTFSIAGCDGNPMAAGGNQPLDMDFSPRGAYPLDFIQIDHYVAGAYANHSLLSTSTSDYWLVSIQLTVCEPQPCLSPFVMTDPDMKAGMFGISQIQIQMNIDSTLKRLFSTANYTIVDGLKVSKVTVSAGIAPYGGSVVSNLFTNPTLLVEFDDLTPLQASKLSTKNVVPYTQYFPQLSSPAANVSLASGVTAQMNSQNYVCPMVPDVILIAVRPVAIASQDATDPASFLTIENINIQFNNESGILGNASPFQLYNQSVQASGGGNTSWLEFGGVIGMSNGSNNSGAAFNVPSLGSMLYLCPTEQFRLQESLASSSKGNFNFSFTVQVTNQYSYTCANPEIVVVFVNSGFLQNSMGQTSTFLGILDEKRVIETKAKTAMPDLDRQTYERLVGGKFHNRQSILSKLYKHIGKHAQHAHAHQIMDGGSMSAGVMHKKHSKSPKGHKLARFLK